MTLQTIAVNTPAKLYFKGTPGQTVFPDCAIIKDGVFQTVNVTLVEYTAGLYSVTYTPTTTGTYMIYIAGNIAGYIECVSRTLYSYVKNIEDESLGSWTWDKVTGNLSLYRRDGTELCEFNVVDTQTTSSRELI